MLRTLLLTCLILLSFTNKAQAYEEVKNFLQTVDEANLKTQFNQLIININGRLQLCERADLECLKLSISPSKTQLISKIDRYFLFQMIDHMTFENGRYDFKSSVNFQSWFFYLKNKRSYSFARYEALDQELRARLNRIYDRKIPKIGSVNIIDYVLYMFSWTEIGSLSNTFKMASSLASAVDGKIVINLNNQNTVEFLQKQLDNTISTIDLVANPITIKEMDEKFLTIAKRLADAKYELGSVSKRAAEKVALEKRKEILIENARSAHLLEARISIYRELNQINLQLMNINSATLNKDIFALELSQRDIYNFSNKYLTHQVALMNMSSDFSGRAMSVGDLLVSNMLVGETEPKLVLELLKISVMNEGWESFPKKALKYLPLAISSIQILFPGVGTIVGGAYAVVSSLENVKQLKNQKVDDAHFF